MMQASELQTYALANQTAIELLDAAERLHLGNSGRDFDWHPGSVIFVAFYCATQAVLFKLAYSGAGCWTHGHLTAPVGERDQLEAIIANHNLAQCAILEFVRVWLPNRQDHALLLAELNRTAAASAIVF